MKFQKLIRVLSLLVLMTSFIPMNQTALAAAALPPVDMFQLPWEQGKAWVALDGFDNGSKRAANSPHNYLIGGAIDFAPHNNMIPGENTSGFWVTAAANGTIVEISKCHMKIAHANGWVSEYQHLAKIQVKLGDVVARNQKLAVIANATTQPVCAGSVDPDIPHLHFALRPNMVGATFAGWVFGYNWFFNSTSFTRNGITVGLFKPLLNAPDVLPTATSVPGTATSVPTLTPPPGGTFTPTPPAGPYVSTTVNSTNVQIGDTALVSVDLHNIPVDGYTGAEFTCTYDHALTQTSNVVVSSLFGADAVTAINDPQNGMFIVAVAGSHGNKAATSGTVFTFNAKGIKTGQTAIECTARVSQGTNSLSPLPSIGTSLTVVGLTPTPTSPFPPPTLSPTPTVPAPLTPTPVVTVIPTVPADWLTFTDVTFNFQFKYPPQGQIQTGSNDSNTRINELPIVQPGTNLTHKFMDVLVGQNVTECKSQQVQDPGVNVTINGITFLKQTGAQGAAGSLFQLVEYSTLRDGVCVNLEFVMQSHDPSSFATPRPVFDYATETALFDQIASTYMWLAITPSSTPGFPTASVSETPTLTFTPIVSPTPIFTSTSIASPTALPVATLSGQVFAKKPVTVGLLDLNNTLIVAVLTNPDGTFNLTAPAGTYNVIAKADGYLNAQGPVTLTLGGTTTKPIITLWAGDIDGNNVIDQFDALTIGMSYNTAAPASADLNNDGIINVFDLELLAQNYRRTGPLNW